MARDPNPVRSPVPELELHIVKFVGGTNAVTKVFGEGVTVTYISAGIVDVTMPADSGRFLGIVGYVFEATTTAAVKSFDLTHGVYNTSTRKVRLNMHNAGTLTNLAALEWLTCTVAFKKVTVTG